MPLSCLSMLACPAKTPSPTPSGLPRTILRLEAPSCPVEVQCRVVHEPGELDCWFSFCQGITRHHHQCAKVRKRNGCTLSVLPSSPSCLMSTRPAPGSTACWSSSSSSSRFAWEARPRGPIAYLQQGERLKTLDNIY